MRVVTVVSGVRLQTASRNEGLFMRIAKVVS